MTDKERSEFEKQKREAERQLNEMYFGTSKRNENTLKMPPFLAPSQNKNSPKKEIKQINEIKKEEEKQKEKPRGLNLLNMLDLKSINMDSDRALILALVLLLSGEETDELLSLALLYIML